MVDVRQRINSSFMRTVPIKIILLSVLSACVCTACLSTRVVSVRTSGPSVPSGGMLYALPKTEICVDVTVLHRDTSQAPYAAFADKMLAGVVHADPYRIADVAVSTRLVADEAHYYYVLPRRTALQVDHRHLLRAVGMDGLVADNGMAEAPVLSSLADTIPAAQPAYNLYDRVDTFYRRGDSPGHPSLLLAKKDARSLRRQALDAAGQISALQEMRSQIVNGDRDDNSAPDVLRYRLQLIDGQIDALIALFVGRDVSETVRYVVTPSDDRSDDAGTPRILFHFSSQRGLADSSAGDAVPVFYSFVRDNSLRSAARFVRFHTGDASRIDRRNSIKYRIAEPVEFCIESALFRLRRTLPVVQFGPVLELPRGRVKARFDAVTGELIYLSR
ncbi:MAG: hypothetical protein AUK63_349 [bacterium P3]|nr:MAG: hypothetical protein AUK63_349 [bacterium P3]KWW42691.1 MAG: hypothetical protein F083_95 [bacterium F083]